MSGVVKPNNIRTVLQDILRPLPQKILVATSGGIDSSAVVLSALDIGKEIEIISFTFKDWFSQDFKAATRLAEKFNLKFIPVYLPIESDEIVNTVNYLIKVIKCKKKNSY